MHNLIWELCWSRSHRNTASAAFFEPIYIERIIPMGTLAQEDLPVSAQASVNSASGYHLSFSPASCHRPQNTAFIGICHVTFLIRLLEERHLNPGFFCFLSLNWNRERPEFACIHR